MSKSCCLSFASLVLATLLSQSAWAENGIRIGLGIGLAQADSLESIAENFNADQFDGAVNLSGDDEASSFTFAIGYQKAALLGLELGFVDFGNYTLRGNLDNGSVDGELPRGEWRLESRVTYLGYTPELNLTNSLELTGLIAAFSSNAKVYVSQPLQAREIIDENSTGVGYGVALKYNFTDFALQVGAKQFAGITEDVDMTLFDFGVYFTF